MSTHLLMGYFFSLLLHVLIISFIPLFSFCVIPRNRVHLYPGVVMDAVLVLVKLAEGYLFLVEEFLLLFMVRRIGKGGFLLLYFLHTQIQGRGILVWYLYLITVFLLPYLRDKFLLG